MQLAELANSYKSARAKPSGRRYALASMHAGTSFFGLLTSVLIG
jgi:hypothetical protein